MKRYNKLRRVAILMAVICLMASVMTGCFEKTEQQKDREATKKITNNLVQSQPTPRDIEYSLERYNLIKRAYWVNGKEDMARAVECPVEKPLGYIVLVDSGAVIAKLTVDGKVSSLNSYLTPDSEYYEYGSSTNEWLADVDGSFGENTEGIFFFTVDGEYHEWNGKYFYSSSPMDVNDPVINVTEVK